RALQVVRHVRGRDPVALGERAVVELGPAGEVVVAEDGEGDAALAALELEARTLEGLVDQRRAPGAVELFLPCRLHVVARRGRILAVERLERASPAALQRRGPAQLVRREAPQRDLEERPEAPALGLGLRQEVALEHPREELLEELVSTLAREPE